MDYFCYQHPDIIAVAKIRREIRHLTPEGEKLNIIFSPVCQECSEGAQSMGTPLCRLTEDGND